MEQSLNQQTTGSSNIPSAKITQNVGAGAWGIPSGSDAYHGSADTSLFSSSLPVLPHQKCMSLSLNFTNSKHVESMDDVSSSLNKLHQDVGGKVSLEDIESRSINFLPDDEDELLAGIMDDFDLSELPSQLEDLEECDLFGSGGGMELDFDPQESLTVSMARTSISDGYAGNGTGPYGLSNGMGAVAGEHPYGEHPSRTLFVRNINSNVEDSELRTLFEQYGAIRTLYTACKHRGFVMISYYDIRAARTAMRALQNKPLRRRKLDIHFSIPKENPSDKDINQGTLVVFNLDPSVSNDDLRQIFGAYGEVKEIRETPHKRHHKFIEFYDVRAAEAALRALNRSDIAGKRIKLEPSRPGGARRKWVSSPALIFRLHQLSHELEQDESRSYRPHVGSPIANSPPGNWAQFSSPRENDSFHTLNHSPGLGSPVTGNHLPGLASILPPLLSSSVKIAPIGKDQARDSHMDQIFPNTSSTHGAGFQHSHSFPEHSRGMLQNMTPSPGTSFGPSTSNASSIGTLTGPQFLWGSPTTYSEHAHSSGWPTPSMGHSFTANGQGQGFPYSSHHGSFIGSSHNSHQHHVGSAPSGVPFDRHFGLFPESPETSFMSPVSFGGMGLNCNEGNFMMNIGARNGLNAGIAHPGNMVENGSPSFRMMNSPRLGGMFLGGGGPFPGPVGTSVDGMVDRGRIRRAENNVSQLDSKKQYQLELDKIVNGEDTRTTLMIKNIPNKYTSKMLLAAIDENHRGTYDFLYLPIDFKAFNGKKWEKFNSEKVASLAYARIQGKAALVTHFQNSSLMNEDKRCRPILFHSEGPEAGDQVNLAAFRDITVGICFNSDSGSILFPGIALHLFILATDKADFCYSVKIIQELFPSNSINIRVHQQDGANVADSPGSPTKGVSVEKADKVVLTTGRWHPLFCGDVCMEAFLVETVNDKADHSVAPPSDGIPSIFKGRCIGGSVQRRICGINFIMWTVTIGGVVQHLADTQGIALLESRSSKFFLWSGKVSFPRQKMSVRKGARMMGTAFVGYLTFNV
ncbi:hypothetical protein ACLOJK_010932 [Asimina triloba]